MFNFSFKELKGEFKKVIWPNKKELAQKTAIVVVFCAVFAVVIGAYDWLFVSLRELIQGLFI
ncbi:MAG: preprotein translocase subunit SecE [Firmicutes bacterium]|nr:preprotein translocase subunit SecE [Bacillota bacterium]